ncbi:cytochrome P450 [Amylostereum chailletii]|nr:cytochrome P450 [Amylostereum chailletii]
MATRFSLLLPAASGLLLCLAVHRRPIRGELAAVAEAAFFAVLCVAEYLNGHTVPTAILYSSLWIVQQLSALALVTVAYRLSPFHPLAKFPGPLINKITSLRIAYIVYTGHRHTYIADLHQKYGKFVRTGPKTLSINSHAAVGPIYVNANAFDKSDTYELPGRSTGNSIFFMTGRSFPPTQLAFPLFGFLYTMATRFSLLLPAASGLLLCLAVHRRPIRGELAAVAEAAFFAVLCVAEYLNGHTVPTAILYSSLWIGQQLSALALVTIAYRLSPFHPLAKFPGPLINKITSLRIAYIVYTGHRHTYIADLHQKYGKFVRTGTKTLSINSHAAVAPIYANANAFDKSDTYELPGRSTGNSIFFMTGRVDHGIRRKHWAGGFTSHTLAHYKPMLDKRTVQLMECIGQRRNAQGVLDIGECVQHWSYDVMGDVTFGGSNRLELMEEGDPKELVKSGQIATVMFEILGEVPSLFQILWYLPATTLIRRLEDYAYSLMLARRNVGAPTGSIDLSSYILKSFEPPRSKLTDKDLSADAVFAIQAGSDTTTGVVIFLLYFVLAHPEVYTKLRAELDTAFPNGGDSLPMDTLNELPYLDAVVNESLRLGTPFPGLPRVVPSSGAVIDDVFVPGDTIVAVPAYAQEIAEENFWPEPLSYKPQRWLPGGLGPGTRTRKSAIMSFSFGPFGCLGKALAIQELRVVVSRLLLSYDVKFAPDFDGEKFLAGVRNMRTTLFDYPLTIVATPRVR